MTRHQFVEPPTPRRCVLVHAKDPERPRSATHGHLCHGHYLNLEQNLAEFPSLVHDVELNLARSNSAGPKVTGDPERALPFDERVSEALADSRDTLATWCRNVVDSHPSGLHAPTLQHHRLSAFLFRHLDWITEQDWVADFICELGEARHLLLVARTTTLTRTIRLGACDQELHCDVTTHQVTSCDGELRGFASLVDDGRDVRPIVCSGCGWEHPPHTWRALSRRLHKDEDSWLTAAQISELLRIPIGTVWYWAHEDEWRRQDRRPKRYHHDDAQRSYDSRRLEVAS